MLKEKFITTRIVCDSRGVITTGIRTNSNGKEIPQSTNYFVVDKFDEVRALYGDKPKRIIIAFPTDNITDFYDCNMQLFRRDGQMVRVCDGEECTHLLDEKLNFTGGKTREFARGSVTPCVCPYMDKIVNGGKNPKMCSYRMYLKAYILNPSTGYPLTVKPVLFRTGSKYNGDAIYTEIKMFQKNIRRIPFAIEVTTKNVAGKIYPRWKISPFINYKSWIEYHSETNAIYKLPEGEDNHSD